MTPSPDGCLNHHNGEARIALLRKRIAEIKENIATERDKIEIMQNEILAEMRKK